MAYNDLEIAAYIYKITKKENNDGNRLIGRAPSLSELDGDHEELVSLMLGEKE